MFYSVSDVSNFFTRKSLLGIEGFIFIIPHVKILDSGWSRAMSRINRHVFLTPLRQLCTN